jgi:hypothetical protein
MNLILLAMQEWVSFNARTAEHVGQCCESQSR